MSAPEPDDFDVATVRLWLREFLATLEPADTPTGEYLRAVSQLADEEFMTTLTMLFEFRALLNRAQSK